MFTALVAFVLLSQVKQVDTETADYLISAAKKQLPQAIAESKAGVIGAKKTLALAKGARGTKEEKAANVARAMDALTKAEKRLTDFQQGRALPLPNFTHTYVAGDSVQIKLELAGFIPTGSAAFILRRGVILLVKLQS